MTVRGRSTRDLATLGVAILLSLIGYWVIFGATVGGDKLRYIGRGERLIAILLGQEAGNDRTWDVFDVLYFVPNFVIGLGHRISGAQYHLVSVGLNVVLFVAAALSIVALSRRLAGVEERLPPFALTILLVLFLGLPGEIVRYIFNSYSSDVISHFVGTIAMILMVRAMLCRESRYWAAAAVMAFVAAACRPSGVVWVVAWTIAYGASRTNAARMPRRVAVAGTAMSLAAFALWPWVMFELARSDAAVSYGLGLVVDKFQTGTVITGRETPRIEEMSGYLDYVRLMTMRFALYLAPFRTGYSLPHVIWNTVVVSLVLATAASGLATLGRQGAAKSGAAALLLISVVLFAVMHAATQVEDWRYYLAAWPPVWVLASVGVCRLAMRTQRFSQGRSACGVER